MAFDVVTYILSKSSANAYTDEKLGAIAAGVNYKGSVDSVKDLPTTASAGDEYNVIEEGYFVYNGTEWISVSKPGPEGPQGPQGPKGAKGDRGEVGPQGPQGPRGVAGAKGEKGDKGDAFKYEDFTPEQLESLKGHKGDQGEVGEKGEKGDPFKYEDFTEEQLAALKGPKGEKGDTGEKGEAFKYEDFTPEQLASLKGESGDKGDKGDPFTYDDFTPEQLEWLRGPQGEKGDKGDPGDPGEVVLEEDWHIVNKVGGYDPAKTPLISKGTKLIDILYTILCVGGDTPVHEYNFYYYEGTSLKEVIDDSWTKKNISADVVSTGYTQYGVGGFKGFLGFAYPKELGQLKAIYQNDFPANILKESFVFPPIEYTVDGVVYYIYIAADRAMLSDDKFDLSWK